MAKQRPWEERDAKARNGLPPGVGREKIRLDRPATAAVEDYRSSANNENRDTTMMRMEIGTFTRTDPGLSGVTH